MAESNDRIVGRTGLKNFPVGRNTAVSGAPDSMGYLRASRIFPPRMLLTLGRNNYRAD
jgi:hypothetical protein